MRYLICLDRYDTVLNNVWYGAALIISRHIICDTASYLIYFLYSCRSWLYILSGASPNVRVGSR